MSFPWRAPLPRDFSIVPPFESRDLLGPVATGKLPMPCERRTKHSHSHRLLSNLQEWSHTMVKVLSRLKTCVVISEEDDITTIPPSIMEDVMMSEDDDSYNSELV